MSAKYGPDLPGCAEGIWFDYVEPKEPKKNTELEKAYIAIGDLPPEKLIVKCLRFKHFNEDLTALLKELCSKLKGRNEERFQSYIERAAVLISEIEKEE